MPRRARIKAASGIYHVINRGNNKQNIFLQANDYYRFLEYLKRSKVKYPTKILGYALMPNHFHLLIKTVKNTDISCFMKSLSTSYACFYNRKYSYSGHLFQARFKSMLVTEDDYLIQLIRYIHDNPVRASLIDEIEDYPYTSFKSYLTNDENLVDVSELKDSPYAKFEVESLH